MVRSENEILVFYFKKSHQSFEIKWMRMTMIYSSQGDLKSALLKGRHERSRQFRKIVLSLLSFFFNRTQENPNLSLRHNRGTDLCKG